MNNVNYARPFADTRQSVSDGVQTRLFPMGAEETEAPPARQILVVDDDADCRNLVARTMARAGFHSDTARDGEEGWGALCMKTYDLVITDNEMPGLEGIDMIRRLRATSPTPPCILITGNLPRPDSVLREILHPGSVIEKPFTCLALIEEVYALFLRGE